MTLQYNISGGQRPAPPTARRWTLGGALAGSLGLHGLAVALAMLAFSGSGAVPEESAAITLVVEPNAGPVATADEVSVEQAAAAIAPPPEEEMPPPTVPLKDFEPPPPPEPLALPDFKTPPPPKPVQTAPRQAPAKPAPAPSTAARPQAAPGPSEATAAPPAVAPSAPSVAPGWNALLAAWLAARKKYPEEARRRSEQGDVTIRFVVAADGRVSDVSVVQSSGSATLDAAAAAVLRGATVPAPGTEQTRSVRIRYNLKD